MIAFIASMEGRMVNESKKREAGNWARWEDAGAVARTDEIDPAGPDPVLELTADQEKACRAGLIALRDELNRPGRVRSLVEEGVGEIVVWDPSGPSGIVFRPNKEAAAEGSMSRLRRARRKDLLAVRRCLNRLGGLEELVRRTGVREMVLSHPVDAMAAYWKAGPLLLNHRGSDIMPNSDFSIRQWGGIEYHS